LRWSRPRQQALALGIIGFMNAAFGLRFLPLFFAFFFAISILL